jgi:hypothetical protein
VKKELILPNFSLGWELEATEAARRPLRNIVVDHDGSVDGEGLEYRTARKIVFDPAASLTALRYLATDPYLETNESCGFHVHIGLGRQSKLIYKWAAAFVSLARHVESEAFTAVPLSRRANEFCRPWMHSRRSVIHKTYNAHKHSNEDRYNWVNPVEVFRPRGIRTIEIRLMGEKHNYPYLLSWISFCRMMAASAWALAVEGDLSREQEEIDTLKEVLDLIKNTFQVQCASRLVAQNTVYLAHKARLVHPYGNVLSEIKRLEDSIFCESFRDERERAIFKSLIENMARHVKVTQAAITEAQRNAEFCVGDTVECIAHFNEGNVTVGRRYRVTRVDEHSRTVGIIADNSSDWFVDKSCLRVVARIEREEGLVLSAA